MTNKEKMIKIQQEVYDRYDIWPHFEVRLELIILFKRIGIMLGLIPRSPFRSYLRWGF